ncbi:TniQ family protein [Streptomyces yunnanensis]|uniref:TniQ family protein n=1 Tax=Streptomyces yunnanensis TaxID=156453 RepID=UPI003B82DB02
MAGRPRGRPARQSARAEAEEGVVSEPRTLAIRVLPQPGESLDSWLEALARRSWTSLSALLDALGLPTEERTHYLLTGLPPEMFQRLKKQLNLRVRVLEQSAVPPALFGRRAPHWRFCPQCLNEGQGRFPTRWWLPWTFACTKHQVLLHRHCPSCHAEPRGFLPRSVHLHPPGRCMRRTGLRTVCGADLGELPALALPTGTLCCRPRISSTLSPSTNGWTPTEPSQKSTSAYHR